MNQGELEKLPAVIVRAMNELQIRIMEDIVRRIRINGFSTASADWQFMRLIQLGLSMKQIKKWVQDLLKVTDKEIDHIYSDEVYKQYMTHSRAYDLSNVQQIPFEENKELQQLIEGVKRQTRNEFTNITNTMGFVKKAKGPAQDPQFMSLTEYYQKTLDDAIMDIHSGAFDYNTVIKRTIDEMTKSGIRTIDYESGWHNRVPVAARRAIMTGFRQVQGQINEQVAEELHTDYYEITVHIGARPTHQPWEGRVWSMEQMRSTEEGMPGLGSKLGLHGINCYHDYNPFIPGISVRTYTDEQLDEIHRMENEKKEYMGKEYTTYEALQRQRQLETAARRHREEAHLLEEGGGSPEDIQAAKSRYQKVIQTYTDFSKKMGLPMQKERIYQDGLKVDMRVPKNEKPIEKTNDSGIIKSGRESVAMDLQLFAEKAIKKQTSRELRKGIESLEKEIAEHQDKILNPQKYYPDWDKQDPRYQAGSIRHWEKEIRNARESIKNRRDELKRRGELDE